MDKLDFIRVIDDQTDKIKSLTESYRVHLQDVTTLGMENRALLKIIERQGIKIGNQESVNLDLKDKIEGYQKILEENGFEVDVNTRPKQHEAQGELYVENVELI